MPRARQGAPGKVQVPLCFIPAFYCPGFKKSWKTNFACVCVCVWNCLILSHWGQTKHIFRPHLAQKLFVHSAQRSRIFWNSGIVSGWAMNPQQWWSERAMLGNAKGQRTCSPPCPISWPQWLDKGGEKRASEDWMLDWGIWGLLVSFCFCLIFVRCLLWYSRNKFYLLVSCESMMVNTSDWCLRYCVNQGQDVQILIPVCHEEC